MHRLAAMGDIILPPPKRKCVTVARYVISLMSQSQNEYARVIEWTPKWSSGAPCPHIFCNEHDLFLAYCTDDYPATILVTFEGVHSHRFGIVNDEAISGHPLYSRGLKAYQAHVVENSEWITELKQIHKVHPYYSEKHWAGYKHYLLSFHDNIFEVIFNGEIRIEELNISLSEALPKIVSGLLK